MEKYMKRLIDHLLITAGRCQPWAHFTDLDTLYKQYILVCNDQDSGVSTQVLHVHIAVHNSSNPMSHIMRCIAPFVICHYILCCTVTGAEEHQFHGTVAHVQPDALISPGKNGIPAHYATFTSLNQTTRPQARSFNHALQVYTGQHQVRGTLSCMETVR